MKLLIVINKACSILISYLKMFLSHNKQIKKTVRKRMSNYLFTLKSGFDALIWTKVVSLIYFR
jgi:hypothetical protein